MPERGEKPSHSATGSAKTLERPSMRRRQTTHTQFKIKHAATLREFQGKSKTLALRLTYDGQEVVSSPSHSPLGSYCSAY
jgi:nicotinic acid phosphoribosyltransferase